MGGGVTANLALRQALPQVQAPSLTLALDNALMIAMAGFWQAKAKDFTSPNEITAEPNLKL